MPSSEVTNASFEAVVFSPGGTYTVPSGESEVRVDKEKVLNNFPNNNDNFDKTVDQAPFALSTKSIIFRQRGTPYFVSKSDPASYIKGSKYWYKEQGE